MEFTLSGRTDIREVNRKRTDLKSISILEYANKNRHLDFFNDVVICTGNNSYPANKLVLSCYSPLFEKMFKVEMKGVCKNSVEIDCVDGNSMNILIEFIYTGCININKDNVCKLLSAAHYLQLEDVKQFCFDFIFEAITPENCFFILSIAHHYENDSLSARAEETIEKCFSIASTTTEFKCLSLDEVSKYVFKPKQHLLKETSKFNALVAWTSHDEENRKSEFPKLLERLNLQNLSSKFFEDVILKESLVMENHELCKLFLQVQQANYVEMKKRRKRRILSLGGTDAKSKVAEILISIDDTAIAFPDLPDGQSHGCSVILQDYLYYVGGYRGGSTNTVWRMNINEKEHYWERVQSMTLPRCDMGAAVVNSVIVVVGGFSGSDRMVSGETYSPMLNRWTFISPMIQYRSGNCLVACKGDLYSIGGCDDDGYLSSVERLAAGDRGWELVAPMQTPRSYHASVSVHNCIYVFGGNDEVGEPPLNSVEMYDPTTNQWTYVSDMIFRRSGCSAAVLEEKIYVVGGLDEKCQAVTEVECYDPFMKEWRIVEKTDCDLFNHSLAVF